VIVGLLGAAGAIVGALWACANAWWSVWEEAEVHSRSLDKRIAAAVVNVVKRGLESALPQASPTGLAGSAGLQPLVSLRILKLHSVSSLIRQIPGVTIPLSHLPTLVLAFLLNQLVHEMGHALSAAMYVGYAWTRAH
jgi:S2P endopeptidase